MKKMHEVNKQSWKRQDKNEDEIAYLNRGFLACLFSSFGLAATQNQNGLPSLYGQLSPIHQTVVRTYVRVWLLI